MDRSLQGYNLKLNLANRPRILHLEPHTLTGVRSARQVGGSRRISSREAPI